MSSIDWQSDIRQKLSTFTKAQLVDLLMTVAEQLPQKTEVLHNAIGKAQQQIRNCTKVEEEDESNTSKHGKNPKQVFSMSKYRQRHVALQIQYDGVNYCGFACQESETAIENYLFAALTKVNLIEDRKNCNYSRCGRTDRGVSALGQVIALNLRSAIPKSIPDDQLPRHAGDSIKITIEEKKKVKSENGTTEETVMVQKEIKELDYCTMINRCLPEDIRVIGWTPVSPEFSARFSATYRRYRYFFLKKDLDIEAMKVSAGYLIGSHDFRNICKLDVANVTNFVREIFYANVVCFEPCEHAPERSVWMLEIQGIAFLWHMVRCIMALLFMVGEKKENPEIVATLLDINQTPAKPSYAMAEDLPLVLHECGFDHLRLEHTPRNLWNLCAHYRSILERHTIAASRAKNALDFIMCRRVRKQDLKDFEKELVELNDKAMKKLSNKTRSKETALGTTASKRKYSHISSSDDDVTKNDLGEDIGCSDEIQWIDAIAVMYNKTSLRPGLESAFHIPLMLRNREHAYSDRIQNLSGLKKDRYERHISLSDEAARLAKESTTEFFERMRKQGSI